jgi:hypothetical protein
MLKSDDEWLAQISVVNDIEAPFASFEETSCPTRCPHSTRVGQQKYALSVEADEDFAGRPAVVHRRPIR